MSDTGMIFITVHHISVPATRADPCAKLVLLLRSDSLLARARLLFPEVSSMKTLGDLARWLASEIAALVDLAITYWVITAIVLLALIYTAGRRRRINRRVF